MAEDKLTSAERDAAESARDTFDDGYAPSIATSKAMLAALDRLAPKPAPMTDEELAAAWEYEADKVVVMGGALHASYSSAQKAQDRAHTLRNCARMLRERGK